MNVLFEVDECSLIFLSIFSLAFETSLSNKATSKPKNVDGIEDIMEMVELMISLEVLAKGCQTLDEMRVLVKEKMARHNNWRMVNEVRLFYVAQPEVVTK